MLYDAGRFGSPVMGTHSIAGFLWSRGITHLDAVILSHADVDHYNALPGLIERFSATIDAEGVSVESLLPSPER